MQSFELFIDGAWRPAATGETYESINPANEEAWAVISAGGTADVNAAVAAARRSFDSGVWRNKPASERAAILRKMAEMLVDRQDELALYEVQDSGGTFRKANMADIPASMQTLTYYADLIEGFVAETEDAEFVPVESRNLVIKQPIGVVAAITPWNFPLAAATWKVAPALAAGCSIVLKPSPLTPVSTLILAEIAFACGVPAGVLNVIAGPSDELGAALVSHPDIDKIAFTGSSKVGQAVMRIAADRLKPVTLELGGKSANIILEDANLDGAIRGALFATFFHSGQICQSGTRLLVHRSLVAEVSARLVEEAKKIAVGDPMDIMNTFGPLISERQRGTVERYVALAREEGATCLLGGKRPEAFDKGYYYEPTIFGDVTNQMKAAREEIFGPVVCIIPFDTDDEAIAIANDSLYGLAGAVWTADVERGLALARRIDAGTVWVNDYHLLNPKYPFGGFKQSGFGRELSHEGLAIFQQTKHIHVGQPTGSDTKIYFNLVID
jgi:aldehyde dehydrogenase (NAD+)